jgi:hypothetical protein
MENQGILYRVGGWGEGMLRLVSSFNPPTHERYLIACVLDSPQICGQICLWP